MASVAFKSSFECFVRNIWVLCAIAYAIIVQCHLVKGLGGKYFINYQSVSWLANSKCAYMNKLYEAAGA